MAGHVTDAHMMSKENRDREHKYEVEEAARTLTKAEEIKKNKKLYDEACQMMTDQMKNMGMAMPKKGMNMPKGGM